MLGVRSQVRWETVGSLQQEHSAGCSFAFSELLAHCKPVFPHAKYQGCTADAVPAHANLKHLLDTTTHSINQGTVYLHAAQLALLAHCSAETWEETVSSRSIRVNSVSSQSNSWRCPTSQREITCITFIPPTPFKLRSKSHTGHKVKHSTTRRRENKQSTGTGDFWFPCLWT